MWSLHDEKSTLSFAVKKHFSLWETFKDNIKKALPCEPHGEGLAAVKMPSYKARASV